MLRSSMLNMKKVLYITFAYKYINVGILTFMSRIKFLSFAPEFPTNFDNFKIYEQLKFHAQLSNYGPRSFQCSCQLMKPTFSFSCRVCLVI